MITILVCFIRKKKAKLFKDLHTHIFQGITLDLLGSLKLPPDPQLQSFLALPRTDAPIFFMYYPLGSLYLKLYNFSLQNQCNHITRKFELTSKIYFKVYRYLNCSRLLLNYSHTCLISL